MRSRIGVGPRCKTRKIAVLEQRLEILVEGLSNRIAGEGVLQFVSRQGAGGAQQQGLQELVKGRFDTRKSLWIRRKPLRCRPFHEEIFGVEIVIVLLLALGFQRSAHKTRLVPTPPSRDQDHANSHHAKEKQHKQRMASW